MTKLTTPQRRVLTSIHFHGGRATAWQLAYPRANMMHRLEMSGLVYAGGRLNAWGAPIGDGYYELTDAGRAALSLEQGEKP